MPWPHFEHAPLPPPLALAGPPPFATALLGALALAVGAAVALFSGGGGGANSGAGANGSALVFAVVTVVFGFLGGSSEQRDYINMAASPARTSAPTMYPVPPPFTGGPATEEGGSGSGDEALANVIPTLG